MKKLFVLSLVVVALVGCSDENTENVDTEVDAGLSAEIEADLVAAGLIGDEFDLDVDSILADLDESLAEEEKKDTLMEIAKANKCLLGSWKLLNFSDYMVAGIKSNSQMDIPVSSTDSGDLIITFDGKNMVMTENNFMVTATMYGQEVPVDVDATGTVAYTADNISISTYGATGNVGTETDNPSNGGKLTSSFDISNFDLNTVFFQCDSDSLVWEAEGSNFPIDLRFSRM
jgi:hypothetical protein